MTYASPSISRRQYLIQRGMRFLCPDTRTHELFEVLDELFGLVLTPTYLLNDLADNPPEHHTTVLGYMMEIATGEGFDWSTVREAAAISLLHDIWPVRKITSQMIRSAPNHERPALEEERTNSVPIHMQKGSEHAQDILIRLNRNRGKVVYEDTAIKRICAVIGIHDNPKIGTPIPTADILAVAFREADRLWMQDPRGVQADLVRNGNNFSTRQDRVAQAEENVKSYREERAKYAAFPAGDFIDTETLFRTKTGHGIFKRLRSYWECERLLAAWLAVKAESDE